MSTCKVPPPFSENSSFQNQDSSLIILLCMTHLCYSLYALLSSIISQVADVGNEFSIIEVEFYICETLNDLGSTN